MFWTLHKMKQYFKGLIKLGALYHIIKCTGDNARFAQQTYLCPRTIWIFFQFPYFSIISESRLPYILYINVIHFTCGNVCCLLMCYPEKGFVKQYKVL